MGSQGGGCGGVLLNSPMLDPSLQASWDFPPRLPSYPRVAGEPTLLPSPVILRGGRYT